MQWSSIGEVKNAVHISTNIFSLTKISDAHLQYVWHIPAAYQKDAPKKLGGVDFTKYELSAISRKVKNPVHLSKLFFHHHTTSCRATTMCWLRCTIHCMSLPFGVWRFCTSKK